MADLSVTVGSEKDFLAYLSSVINQHDKNTLLRLWKVACLQKRLIFIRRLGILPTQVMVIDLASLPTIKEKLPRPFAKGDLHMTVIPNNSCLVFGKMIQDNDEVGTAHAEVVTKVVNEPKKRGRKKNVRPNDGPIREVKRQDNVAQIG